MRTSDRANGAITTRPLPSPRSPHAQSSGVLFLSSSLPSFLSSRLLELHSPHFLPPPLHAQPTLQQTDRWTSVKYKSRHGQVHYNILTM